MRTIKRILKICLIILVIPLLYFTIVTIHGTIVEYKGPDQIELDAFGGDNTVSITDSTINILIWNIGYAALGKETAFFYDNGRVFHSGDLPVIMPKNLSDKNDAGIQDLLRKHPADFFLLQEVDQYSKRSYYKNQLDSISSLYPAYEAYYGVNYKVKRIPVPYFEPFNVYGQVDSGIATYSRFASSDALRLQLPGEYDWPYRIFHLDRCIIVNRYDYKDKELVLINLHLSAYDKGGVIKAQQMEFLKQLCLEEYEKGNYVILGGDWNQCPPDFEYDQLAKANATGFSQINIDKNFMEAGWTWAYDSQVPSNRKLRDPYDEDQSFVTILDFFLCSPNVGVNDVHVVSTNFEWSDHQPVMGSFTLK